jgi:hypothetical protein
LSDPFKDFLVFVRRLSKRKAKANGNGTLMNAEKSDFEDIVLSQKTF